MTIPTPASELVMSVFLVQGNDLGRLDRAVASLSGLMLPPPLAQLRDAAAAWLGNPQDAALEQGLADALALYCAALPERATRVAAAQVAALDAEPPLWAGRADLQ
ncbi:hypothetical protein [Azospirillum sp.]|uniref:hypothetical protein n=1 Tax=Azospirillum sp. TaxID=34012 RepID=UPI0026039D86|nr:hypothetical protein [Azospirillum sp.]